MPERWFAAIVLIAAVPAASMAGERGYRILHYERMERVVQAAARPHDYSFEAYGRRFDLELEPNERIRVPAKRSAARSEAEPLRGRVVGAARSWARITRTPAGLYGMIFDGRDLYAVEPAREAARFAVQPLAALRADAPVIYRLADALMPDETASCGTASPASAAEPQAPTTALQAYESLRAELQTAAVTLAPARQIEVAAVGDFEFSTASTSDGLTPEAAVAARMNIVDGLFSAQLGVKVLVTDITIFRTPNDPFSSTLEPSKLLDELADWRQANATQTARGVTHLLTGRDLSGSTVGIAFVGAICRSRSAAGLTQGTLSPTNAALVIAHEMGHNFGAPHDGEAGSACETTAQTFLMAPRLNGSQTFSQCSLERIAPVISAASCLARLDSAEVGLEAPPPGARPLRDRPFAYSFMVRSDGTLAAERVEVVAQLPQGFSLGSAAVSGGTCAAGAGDTVSCSLGTLPAGALRTITLDLTPHVTGPATLTLSLSAANDSFTGNNQRQVDFETDPSADLSVSLTASTASIPVQGSMAVTATVANLGASAVSDGKLTLSVSAGLTVDSIGANPLGCSLQGEVVSCSAAPLAAGSSQAVTFEVSGRQAGAHEIGASIASALLGDPVTGNNTARLTASVNAPAQSTSSASAAAAGSSGGGGSLGRAAVLLLLALGARRLRAPARP